jgi:biuret amidohydrolase
MPPQDYMGDYKRRFAIDLGATALLVIDMQYASGCREQGLGANLAAEGKQAEARWRFDRIRDVVLPNLRRLLDTFRARGIPIVYITLGSETGDFTDVAPYLRELLQRTDNRVGAHNHQILDAITPQDGEVVVNKTTASAFLSTKLHTLLQERGISQLLLAGISTNSCVESTGRDGADLGYECVMIDDCCSCASENLHRAALANFDRLFGRVATTRQILGEVDAAPPRRSASTTIRRGPHGFPHH